jgi:hypothetical protein
MKIHRLLSSLQRQNIFRQDLGIGCRKIWFNPPFLWKCLYQVRAIAVFTVFRLLTDFVCLLTDLWVLPFPLEDCSVFGNFVITLIYWSLDVKQQIIPSGSTLPEVAGHPGPWNVLQSPLGIFHIQTSPSTVPSNRNVNFNLLVWIKFFNLFLYTVDSRYLEFDGTMEKIRVNRSWTQEELW